MATPRTTLDDLQALVGERPLPENIDTQAFDSFITENYIPPEETVTEYVSPYEQMQVGIENRVGVGSVKASNVIDWGTPFLTQDALFRAATGKTQTEYKPSNAEELLARAGEFTVEDSTAGSGSYVGGGWGPQAYGVTSRTGLSSQKGKAPYGLQSPFWNALQRANAAMKAAGLGSFGITDGWRSYEAQVAVKKKKGDLAATPGRSVHGLGWAADLRLNAQQQKWLEKNGSKFGMARLPSESWHWQYTPSKALQVAQNAEKKVSVPKVGVAGVTGRFMR